MIAIIRTAKKRGLAMGVCHPWQRSFDRHPLAAAIDNYTLAIDVERAADRPDYLSMLVWIAAMAGAVNSFCAAHRVAGDAAAEYWLERFLWRCDVVAQLDMLPGAA